MRARSSSSERRLTVAKAVDNKIGVADKRCDILMRIARPQHSTKFTATGALLLDGTSSLGSGRPYHTNDSLTQLK